MTGKLPTLERQNREATYLCLQLTAEIAAILPTRADPDRPAGERDYHVQEVLSLASARLTPLPGQPHWVMGLLNQRGRIFGVIDLADFLGLSPLTEEEQNLSCTILRVERRAIALSARQIKGILRMNPDRVQSVDGKLSPSLKPYVQGSILRSPDEGNPLVADRFLVLDPLAIARAAIERRGKRR